MINNHKWLLVIPFFFPWFVVAQCSLVTPVPFISINDDVHYRSLADIGVITSGYAEEVIAWKQNPSLLGGVKSKSVFEINNIGFHGRYKNVINTNVQIPIVSRFTFGISVSLFPVNSFSTKNNGTQKRKEIEGFDFSTALGYELSENFNLGIGFSYFTSTISEGNFNSDTKALGGIAFDFGGKYKGEIELNADEKLVFEAGFTLNNIGPKVTYDRREPARAFLPGELLLGGRIGWLGKYAEGRTIGVNLLAQLDHSLFPECDFTDEDQNGLPDNLEKNVLTTAFGSFGDHPNGLTGEIQKMYKRIAIEPWIDVSTKWKVGFGLGYAKTIIEEEEQEFFTMGINGSFKDFKLNVYRQEYFDQNEILSSPWGISLAFHKFLIAK